MEKVQTITINGKTYQISDPNAATKEEIGNISAALDELHAYAQELIHPDGGATE